MPMPTAAHRRLRPLLLIAALSLLPAAAWASAAAPLAKAKQLLVVTTADWDADHGRMQAYERDGKRWRAHGPAIDVAVGRSGSAWGLGLHPVQADGPQKQEGDGRSPAGVFGIGEAFGYAASARTKLPYQPMLATSYCMDVPDSALYNRIVDAERVGNDAVEGSTEPMRLDLHNDGDRRYREGFVIEHNPRAESGRGSCIFAHLWRTPGEATAGCTAMEPDAMTAVLAWLNPASTPLFVLLPHAEYQRLQPSWQLPVLAEPGR